MNNVFKSILVPLDGSEGAERAASYAADLAKAVGCPVVMLYVYHPDPNRVMGMAGLSRERVQEISKEAGAKVFKAVEPIFQEAGVSFDEKVVWGDPREEIIALAEEHQAMIVMGRRGMGQMKQLMVGSVSAGVVHSTKQPVTIVN
ncbi:MAG: universal stress protein [Wenzhouxiangella sp.]